MANRVFLLGLDEDFFESDEPEPYELLEAANMLPVLWLALFGHADIRLYEGVPFLFASRESVLARFDARFEALVGFFGEPSRTLIGQFREFFDTNAFANYLVNTYELHMMDVDDDRLRRDLERYLDDLDAIAAGTAATRELPVLLQVHRSLAAYPFTGKPLLLCGDSYSVPLPWEPETA